MTNLETTAQQYMYVPPRIEEDFSGVAREPIGDYYAAAGLFLLTSIIIGGAVSCGLIRYNKRKSEQNFNEKLRI